MADQARIQDSKEKFLAAFYDTVSQEQAAKAQYQEEESMGLTNGVAFDDWAIQNVSHLGKTFSQQVSKSKAVPSLHRSQAPLPRRQSCI